MRRRPPPPPPPRPALAPGFVFALVALAAPATAWGHGFRPGRLDLRERPDGRYEVTFKIPRGGETGEDGLAPVRYALPPRCRAVGGAPTADLGLSVVERAVVDCGSGGLAGATVRFTGLEDRGTDVLVRFAPRRGEARSVVARADAPDVRLPGAAGGRRGVAGSYLALGVEHIATGADHLLFVLGLLLLVRGLGAMARAVTAFTLGHSATLALAALGLVRLRPAPVEAGIALSILLLAAEVARDARARPTLAARRPWLVAGGFGLVHGLGFAGALAEVGLPDGEIPLALAAFNAGVELGQLAFVVACAALAALAARVAPRATAPGRAAAAYGIGALASYWCIDRIGRLFA